MAEESGEKREITSHKQNERSAENGWVVVASQKRPGYYYDFNVRTGEAYWRDGNLITSSEKVMDQHENQFEFQEPTEPPVNHPPANTQKRKIVSPINYQPSKQTKAEPTVNSLHHANHNPQCVSVNPLCCCQLKSCHYNGQNNIPPKMIQINDQFSGPYTIPPPPIPYGNSSQCSHITPSNDCGVSVPPGLGYPWTVPPPPLPEPIYLPNLKLQNTAVPLRNRIHETPMMFPNDRLGLQTNSVQRHPQKFVNKKPFMNNDLRGLLNRRNRQDLQSDVHDSQQITDDKIDKPKAEVAIITEGELNPDDTDPWLEKYTDAERNKLKIGMEYIWEVAAEGASRDSWYIVPTQSVLINNIRFLSIVVKSDERARLLAPHDVVRALRSTTFSNNERVADYAKRALILIRQTSKFSDTLNAPDVKSCLKFIEQGKHVVLLVDEKDAHYEEMNKVAPVFTVTELKNSLALSWEEKNAAMLSKINITFSNIIAEPAKLTDVYTTPSPTPSPQKASGSDSDTAKAHDHSSEIKNIESHIPTTPGKMTVNASVQTDLIMVPPAEEGPKELISHAVDAENLSNDNTIIKVPTRKIRLKRQNQPSNICDSDGKKQFKWRKRKDTGSTSNASSQKEEMGPTENGSFSLSTSTADLLSQQNDNAVDFGVSHDNVDPKIVEETSTSGVISNSLDSDSLFRVSAETCMNESILDRIEEVAYEITSDFMKKHLSTRIDEWVARFDQIMEEVLTEVLYLDPPYVDSYMPPPWTVLEATKCVGKKFLNHRIIAASCKKLTTFINEKSDENGNIKAKNISPEDFMKMYNCGVQLINVLQMNLQNDDLKLASTRLTQLLSDIQENNSDGASIFMDTFENDDNSPNISDNVSTNMSSTDVADNSQSAPVSHDSSHQKDKNVASNNSTRFGLKFNRTQREKVAEKKTESEIKNAKHSLFRSLGLKENNSKQLTSLVRTISNEPRDQTTLTPPTEKTPKEADIVQNNVEVKPSFVRNFVICPELEKKMKGFSRRSDEYDYENEEEDNNTKVDLPDEDIEDDFTEDIDIKEPEKGINIHKFFVRITCDIQLCMVNSRRFCEDTYESIKTIDKWNTEYKKDVKEKIKKVSQLLLSLCGRLKCILNRDPTTTEFKFRGILKAFGTPDTNLKELKQHLDNYRIKIETYLKHAYFLLQFVKLLADAIKSK